ncbi:hypothetical protein OED52_20230 [Rhodococcus sp. Z13]|uniref:Uncharacterized protein n=1 Tax=Rhodococcus sacchari TaxID=2962047 RepID=A0ACD4DFY8_9NOCA|nr:hypothetical protein [Rhodococcus sp. Z13]UYP18926.1 hypothetical protein OED52_20230 [Rhodococcus sp. Z13]
MYAQRETYFGWTSRRVPLSSDLPRDTPRERTPHPDEEDSAPSGVTLDRILPESLLHGRLVAYHDAEEDKDYVAVAVGEIRGEDDVPVHAVEEECLVVSAAHSPVGGILVGTDDDDLDDREIERQLRRGGPVRDLLEYLGVRSVVVDWTSMRV